MAGCGLRNYPGKQLQSQLCGSVPHPYFLANSSESAVGLCHAPTFLQQVPRGRGWRRGASLGKGRRCPGSSEVPLLSGALALRSSGFTEGSAQARAEWPSLRVRAVV